MIIIPKLKEFNENMQKTSYEALHIYRYMLFLLVGVDLVGVFWYLQWKSWGMAILMVLIGCLVYILLLERRLEEKMVFDDEESEDYEEEEGEDYEEDDDEEDKPLKKKVKKVRKKSSSNDMEFELPSAEDYNKRMEKALGSFG